MVVCTKPDLLTYCLGRLFIKTKYFALPNIILNKPVYREYIVAPWGRRDEMQQWIASDASRPRDDVSTELREKLAAEKSLDSLMAEFLREFV